MRAWTWLKRLVVVALFLAALYLCIRVPAQNADPVTVDYLLGRIEGVPLWLALLCAFGLGVLASAAVAFYRGVRLRLLARRYRRTTRGLEAEIHELRSLPLADAEPQGDGVGEELGAGGRAAWEREA